MRMMLRVRVDAAHGNEGIKTGTLPKVMMGFIEKHKPEAAYFTVDCGKRTAFFVFDMQDSSAMPSTAESFFMELGADVHYTPVMTGEDLRKGLKAAGFG